MFHFISIIFIVQIFTVYAATPASLCGNKKFKFSEFAATDPTLNLTSLISLSLTCDKPLEKPLSLYGWISNSNRIVIGVVDSKLVSPYNYQFSVTTSELNELPAGIVELRVLDDEGLALLRKAQRDGLDLESSASSAVLSRFKFQKPHTARSAQSALLRVEYLVGLLAIGLLLFAYDARKRV